MQHLRGNMFESGGRNAFPSSLKIPWNLECDWATWLVFKDFFFPFFFQMLLANLNSQIQKDLGLLWGVDKEMKRLSNLLSTRQVVPEHAEEMQIKDKAIQNWLWKLLTRWKISWRSVQQNHLNWSLKMYKLPSLIDFLQVISCFVAILAIEREILERG